MFEKILDVIKQGTDVTLETSKKATGYVADRAGELSSFLAQKELLSWTEEVFKSTASVYDKAMDAEYLRNHIAGGRHRLFDQGHDLVNAWEKVRDASDEDTFLQEVVECSHALWKDFVTPMGLPFATLDQQNFDEWAHAIIDTIPGISKDYIYDLCSFDGMEVMSTGFGAVGAILCLKKEDKKRLSGVITAMGVQSVVAANPIMAIVVLSLVGYAYVVKKQEFDLKEAAKSGATTGLSAAVFACLGLNVLVEFAIVLTLRWCIVEAIKNRAQISETLKTHAEWLAQQKDNILNTILQQAECIMTKPKPQPILFE
jgi:hypothetical protein